MEAQSLMGIFAVFPVDGSWIYWLELFADGVRVVFGGVYVAEVCGYTWVWTRASPAPAEVGIVTWEFSYIYDIAYTVASGASIYPAYMRGYWFYLALYTTNFIAWTTYFLLNMFEITYLENPYA